MLHYSNCKHCHVFEFLHQNCMVENTKIKFTILFILFDVLFNFDHIVQNIKVPMQLKFSQLKLNNQ